MLSIVQICLLLLTELFPTWCVCSIPASSHPFLYNSKKWSSKIENKWYCSLFKSFWMGSHYTLRKGEIPNGLLMPALNFMEDPSLQIRRLRHKEVKKLATKAAWLVRDRRRIWTLDSRAGTLIPLTDSPKCCPVPWPSHQLFSRLGALSYIVCVANLFLPFGSQFKCHSVGKIFLCICFDPRYKVGTSPTPILLSPFFVYFVTFMLTYNPLVCSLVFLCLGVST